MVFTTHIFVFYFLPLVLLVYYALPVAVRAWGGSDQTLSQARNLWLLAISYVFYGWWNPWFILLMFLVSAVNYGCGQRISQPGATARQRRFWLGLALVFSLGTLGFFKYFMFVQSNVNQALAWFGAEPFSVWSIVLPVGISFYTFQALSYSVDVYRGDAPPARSLSDFACFIALFPQLIAGPIIRYHTVATQLIRRSHTWERFGSGATLFVLGFAKKILLANPLGRVADTAFAAESLTAFDAWFGVIAYAFQIYFDFSGYSDMAVGLGRLVGFEFIKNFNAPYRAESITDFWRRWHISLSTFLRDYLYIPLGGNRHGPGRTYVNLTIVMLLGGLWHGANWTFVIWGAYHGSVACPGTLAGQAKRLSSVAVARSDRVHVRARALFLGAVPRGEPGGGLALFRSDVGAGRARYRVASRGGPVVHPGQPDPAGAGRMAGVEPMAGARLVRTHHLAQGFVGGTRLCPRGDGHVRPGLQSFPLFPILSWTP